jgi:dTDP-4-amino-4,6-dideoxygalactose transaminase
VSTQLEIAVPFLDLKRQYEGIRDEVGEALARVLDSGQYVLGDEVAAFEREFAEYCGSRHAVALNSGTSALHLALLAAGVGPGDEVVTVPMTFVATVAAIDYIGARAVLVDVDPVTCTMDAAQLEAAITPRTRAIVPVHLYGLTADMDAVLAVAARHGVPVVEDAAQAHGAEYRGRRAGSMGLAGCFSFYPGKNLGAYGEGGLVTTDDDAVAAHVRILRDWGQTERYHHRYKGFNYRMDGFQGAILRVKLRRLEEWTEARRRHAAGYRERLAGTGLTLPAEPRGSRHVYHVFAVRHPERDALRRLLQERGVGTGLHYPVPVHLQPAYADLGYAEGAFPVAEAIAREELSLPMFPEMEDAERDYVAEVVAAALGAVEAPVGAG